MGDEHDPNGSSEVRGALRGHNALLAEHLVSLADPDDGSLGQEDHVRGLVGRLVRCVVELLEVQAGLTLLDTRGQLRHVTSSSDSVAGLERMQLRDGEGPCVLATRTGVPAMFSVEPALSVDAAKTAPTGEQAGGGGVPVPDPGPRWPAFGAALAAEGFHFVYSVPMQAQNQVIGALTLFGSDSAGMSNNDQRIARALAVCASSSLVRRRTLDETSLLVEQLRTALQTRVVIEQAKGVLAALGGTDVEAAFNALRTYSRNSNARLHDVARAVVQRELQAHEVLRALYGGDVQA